MGPLTMMALGYGAKALVGAFRKPKVGMLNPEKYKNMLLMSDASANSMRNSAADTTARMNMGNVAAIRQQGAQGGAPMGAVMSSMAGASYQSARAASSIEPQIAGMQQQGKERYYNAMQQYEGAKAQTYNQQTEEIYGDIGNMTQIAMLWKAGYFDDPDRRGSGNQRRFQGQDLIA